MLPLQIIYFNSSLTCSVIFPVRYERPTVTIANQTFHFISTSSCVMVNLLMRTFDTPSNKVKFVIHRGIGFFNILNINA